MCGIAGFSLKPTTEINGNDLAIALAMSIEHRGVHATGFGWTESENGNNYVAWDKSAGKASDVAAELDFNGTNTGIVHTRFTTSGTHLVNANNHPHNYQGILLVHNGIAYNEARTFYQYDVEPETDCDSEVFPMLLTEYAKGGHSKPIEALQDVSCDAALAWLDADQPDTLHLARLEGRPMYYATVAYNGADQGVIMASEEKALEYAADVMGLTILSMTEVREGTYLSVTEGLIDTWDIVPGYPTPVSRYTSSTNTTRGGATYPKALPFQSTPKTPTTATSPTTGQTDGDTVTTEYAPPSGPPSRQEWVETYCDVEVDPLDEDDQLVVLEYDEGTNTWNEIAIDDDHLEFTDELDNLIVLQNYREEDWWDHDNGDWYPGAQEAFDEYQRALRSRDAEAVTVGGGSRISQLEASYQNGETE